MDATIAHHLEKIIHRTQGAVLVDAVVHRVHERVPKPLKRFWPLARITAEISMAYRLIETPAGRAISGFALTQPSTTPLPRALGRFIR